MIVKEIELKDYQEACSIYQECFENGQFPKKLEKVNGLLGLYQENILIGVAQIYFFDNFFEGKRIAFINSLCIHKSFQNQGWGDFFLKEIIQFCKKMGASRIQLTSNRKRIYAHKLYQKNSFEEIDTIYLKKEI